MQTTSFWLRWIWPTALVFGALAVAHGVPLLAPFRPYVAPVLLLYLPLVVDRSLDARALGWRRPGRRGWVATLVSGAVIFGVFWAVTRYGLWGPWRGAPEGLPGRFGLELLFAALPEEIFFRGWLLPRAERRLAGRKIRLAGSRHLELTAGNAVTAAAFAVLHLANGFRLDRLGTFFPGLWFGWLTRASGGSVVPAVLMHALANALMAAATGH